MDYLVEKIAESVKTLGVKAVYGDAVTIDGVEVVPVALVAFGFGGGNGSGDEGEGGGGGGGGYSIPVGAYVGGPSGPSFRPNIIALLAVLIPVTLVGGKALSSVIRALKK